MRVTLCKFCEYCCQLQNGRHSLIGIFDSFVVPELPFDHPPMFLAVQMEFEPIEGGQPMEFLSALIDEDGREVFSVNTGGQIPPNQGGNPIKLQIEYFIPSLRLERKGDYRLDLTLNGQKVAEERLPVLVIPPQRG